MTFYYAKLIQELIEFGSFRMSRKNRILLLPNGLLFEQKNIILNI